MDELSRLTAVGEIVKLKARYFRCMDTKDWEGLAKVFAADAEFDLSQVDSVRHPISGMWKPPFDNGNVYKGHAAVLGMIRTAVERLYTAHHGHMPEIEITDERTARGVWAMEDMIWNAEGEPSFRLHGYGHYHETYVRLETGWVIKSTRITRLYLERG